MPQFPAAVVDSKCGERQPVNGGDSMHVGVRDMIAEQTQAQVIHQEAFAFIQALARELSAGKIDIPSFPEVAMRVRKVLQDESVSAEQVTRVIGAEPALAARLLQIANSAAFNVSGRRVTELRGAVTRLGFNVIRSAAISFAISQLRKVEELKAFEAPLDALWKRSANVAAMSYVVARELTPVNPDAAMLAGLLHGVGRLYILVRAAHFPTLFADTGAYSEIVRDWHASIAKAILESWEVAEEIVSAVHVHEDLEYTHEGPIDLGDVLILSNFFVSQQQFPDAIELNLQGVRPARHMQVDVATFRRLVAECGSQIEALQSALGG